MITISRERYIKLLLAEEVLSRLEAGGVDNWDWYGDALNPEDEPDLDTYEEMLIKEYGGK